MNENKNPARLIFSSGDLEYHVDGVPAWKVPADSVAAVGEYTTGHGPLVDDYFIVFVARSGDFHQASFYAKGREDALWKLGKTLGTTLRCTLSDSTSFRTQLLWPKELITAPLFSMRRFESRSLWGKIRDSLGIAKHELELSRAVLEHVKSRRP